MLLRIKKRKLSPSILPNCLQNGRFLLITTAIFVNSFDFRHLSLAFTLFLCIDFSIFTAFRSSLPNSQLHFSVLPVPI